MEGVVLRVLVGIVDGGDWGWEHGGDGEMYVLAYDA